MSTVRESKNTLHFGVLIWGVFRKIIISLPSEKMEKKALALNYKATALIRSWFTYENNPKRNSH